MNFTNITGATTASYTTPALNQHTYYKALVSISGCTVSSLIKKVAVTSITAGTVSTASSTLCTGAVAVLALTGQTTGATIKWQSSTNNTTFADITGATASTYTTPALTATTYYRAVVTISGCTLNTTSQMITVSPIVAGTVAASATTLCAGNPVTLTLSGQTAGASIQWQSSLNDTTYSNISGANAATYVSPNLNVKTFYKAVVSTSTCTASAARVQINVTTVNSGTITATVSTICSGATTVLTLAGQTTGATLQWQSSTNNTTFTNIASATAASYTTPALTQTTYYRVITTASSCSLAAASKGIVVNTAGTISATPAIVCNGTSTTLNLSGQSLGAAIQWQSSANNTTFSNISGAIAATYITPALTANIYYRASVIIGTCNLTTPVAPITITTILPGTATASKYTICAGSNTVLSIANQTAGSTIQWQSSTNNSTFTNITGATTSPYTANNITQNTYFRALVSASTCSVISNALTVLVNPLPVLNITASNVQNAPSKLLTASPSGLTNYNWTNFSVPGVSLGAGTTLTVSPYSSVIYKVEATNANGCVGFDTIIIQGPNYAVFKKKLDGGFYETPDSKLYFKFDGEYIDENLTFKIQKFDQSIVNACAIKRLKQDMTMESAVKNYGDNRYMIDFSNNCILAQGDFYTIEVTNEKEEKFYLRFKR